MNSMDIEALYKELIYDETSKSNLKWNISKQGVQIGSDAGTINQHGYYQIMFHRKSLLVHRIIWMITYGIIPDELEIDYVNKNRLDNNIKNLRIVNNKEQSHNKNKSKNNTTGHLGVYKKRNKWRAGIKIDGKTIHGKTVATIEEAIAERLALEKLYFPSKPSLV